MPRRSADARRAGVRPIAVRAPYGERAATRRPFQGNTRARLEEAVRGRELEEVEQIIERRRINGRIRALELHRVREVVPAAVRDGGQVPVALDELDDRDMVRVLVGDVSLGAQG